MDYKIEIKDLETDEHITNLFFNSLATDVKDIMKLVTDKYVMPMNFYGVLWLDDDPVALLDYYGNVTSIKRLNRRKLELFLG